ncbi:MAG: DNA recombination protein RmuC [Succinivibrio sp.]
MNSIIPIITSITAVAALGLFIFILVRYLALSRKVNELNIELTDTKARLNLGEQLRVEKENEVQSLKTELFNLHNSFNTCSNDNHHLKLEQTRLEEDNNELSVRLTAATDDLNTLKETNAKLNQDLINKNSLIEEKNNSYKTEKDELIRSYEEKLSEKINHYEDKLKERQQQFDTSYKELQEQMKVLGSNLVKSGTEDLSKATKENMVSLVTPLKEELTKFQNFITQTNADNSKKSGELQNEIKRLEESHKTLSKQAEDLVKALRQGGKSQGMWGELQLERVLDAAGLCKGIEYEREVAGDRSNNETGRIDVVLRLPDEHCIIIDAKCSLTAYVTYINADSDAERETALKNHIQSIKKHLDELIRKDYSNYASLNSPDFVFMFVPIDSALNDALRADPSLYDLATKNKIYLVSPSSIMPALRVVSNLWVLSERSERMRELALMAQRIYDKFSNIQDDISDLIRKEDSLKASISQLENRLVSGRGNLKVLIENFDTKAQKQLKMLDGTTIEAEKSKEPELYLEAQNDSN